MKARMGSARGTLAILAFALGLIVAGLAPVKSSATFPGPDGPIAFRQVDPETGFGAPMFRAQPDGTEVSVLTRLPGFFSDWRPDGNRIAFDFFQPDGDEQVATMTPDGRDVRVITSGHGIHEVPSWSPSGRRIVFDFSTDDPNAPSFETRLWTMRANGSHAQPLPMRSWGFDVEPKYAPNGRWIAFMRLRITNGGEQSQAVFIVDLNRHRVRQLTPFRQNAEHPTWSPDSRWITFNTPDGTIKAMRPSGEERHTILPATEGSGGHKPWFSPDGSRILFMCENRGLLQRPPADYNEDICVMNADGSDRTDLTNTPTILENWPSWGPAPSASGTP